MVQYSNSKEVPFYLNMSKLFSFICPKCIYHNLVMLELNKDDGEAATEPVIVDPYKTYELLGLQVFITAIAPLETFIMPFLSFPCMYVGHSKKFKLE